MKRIAIVLWMLVCVPAFGADEAVLHLTNGGFVPSENSNG